MRPEDEPAGKHGFTPDAMGTERALSWHKRQNGVGDMQKQVRRRNVNSISASSWKLRMAWREAVPSGTAPP